MQTTSTDPQTGKTLILNRSARFWLLNLAGLILLITVLVFIFNTAIIRISYSFGEGAIKEDAELFIADSQGDETPLTTFFEDYALINRGSTAIRTTTDSSETRTLLIDLPYFSIPNYKITLQPQHQLSKIGSETLGCNLINPNGTYSYSCSDPESIVKINRPDKGLWEAKELQITPMEVSERYKNGFLGIENVLEGTSLTLSYVVPGSPTKQFALPQDFKASENDIINIITDQSNSSDSSFIIANLTTGNFLHFGSLDQINDPKRFSRTAETNTQFDNGVCAINSSQLVCYYGPLSDDHANIEEHADYRQQAPHGKLEIIKLANPDERVINKTDRLEGGDNIYLTSNDQIFIQDNEMLFSVVPGSNSVKTSLVSRDVSDIGASGDSLFYAAYGGLYQYATTEQTSYLSLRSGRLTTPGISIYGNSVILNAFVNTDEDGALVDIAHAYKLTDKPVIEDQPIKEEVLPYEFVPPITYMDYSDNRIYIGLEPIFTSNPRTGAIRINQKLTKRQTANIKKRLIEDNMLTPGTKLLFR